ncbi:hypothetical protein [Actinokineospora globicatena]|uniref:hypothetical protein n=1 Tax=Actinokineospora globicatena TaxID=103729 RepID=UPI0020A24589|nr:hypothetical protein [Actinokineospora globicatena]MCP2306092.1 hypothetical protein [Actinokineospora globicatena]GLW80034.1 hypothetical protein Aglo01_45150 [Actinokineospora globicatena]GLW86863.1 hypothetical protein Aglo02_45020 [Actinokineospora globicatena]
MTATIPTLLIRPILGAATDLVVHVDTCGLCEGQGFCAAPGGGESCGVCRGTGLARLCPDCDGHGHITDTWCCDTCDGAGQVA